MSKIDSFKDLIVFQKAYKLAMEIFELSKQFPKEEKYSLTDQIRRSSRSVTSNLAEACSEISISVKRERKDINLEHFNSFNFYPP